MPEGKKKQLTEKQLQAKRARAKARRQRRAAKRQQQPQHQRPRVQQSVPKLRAHTRAMHTAPGRVRSAAGNALSDFIACPGDFPQMKFPDPGSVAAAPIKTRQLGTITTNTDDTIEVSLPLWDWAVEAGTDAVHVLLFGQLGRAYMHGPYVAPVSADPFNAYQFHFTTSSTAGLNFSTEQTLVTRAALTQATTGSVGSAKVDIDCVLNPVRVRNTATKPYLGMADRPIGYYKSHTWLWLNLNESLWLQPLWNGGGFAGLHLTVKFIDPNSCGTVTTLEEALIVYASATPQRHYTVPSFGWYCFVVDYIDMQNFDASALTEVRVHASIRNATHMGQPKQCYFIEEAAAEITATHVGGDARRTACSLLMSCMASSYQGAGVISYGRVHMGAPDAFKVKTMTAATGSNRHHILKGCYTYLEFDEHSEQYAPAVTVAGNTCYNLSFDQFLHHICIDPGTAGYGSTIRIPFATTLDMAWEFRTSSQLYRPVVSKLEMQLMYDARGVLNQANLFFFENPLHMRDITALIRKAWSGLRGNARQIATAAKIVAPGALGPLITALGDLLQH